MTAETPRVPYIDRAKPVGPEHLTLPVTPMGDPQVVLIANQYRMVLAAAAAQGPEATVEALKGIINDVLGMSNQEALARELDEAPQQR